MLVLAIIGTLAAGISAVGVIAVGVDWWRNRIKRNERDAREREVSAAVGAMDDKVERLAVVIEALASETQARRPQLTVRFATSDGASPSVVAVKAAVPKVDVEAILANEREAALASLLPISDTKPSAAGAGLFALTGIAGLGSGRFLPVTQKDHDNYQAEVEIYLRAVGKCVKGWLAYLEQRQHLLVMRAQMDNDGGAPAEQARLRLHFPDPCARVGDLATRPERPSRPKFERRELSRLGLGGRELLSLKALGLGERAPINPISLRKRSGPFYEDGSLNVRFEYDAIPHHDPLRTENFIVGVPESGVFVVEWTLGAANLARPATGVLHLEVQHEQPAPEPIVTLAELLNAGRTASARNA